MDLSDSDSSDCEIDYDNLINEAANAAAYETLPEKSRERYLKAYSDFQEWKQKMRKVDTNEKILLAYFFHLSHTMKPNSL